jgi:hypothetical protein
MLTPAHLLSDLAAEHTRTLRAEADAYRLARTATHDQDRPAPRRWFGRAPQPARFAPSGGAA